MLFRVLKFKPARADRDRPVADRPPDGQPGHRSSSGTAPPPASCGSRSATPAARCGTRPGRPARRATRCDRGYVVAAGPRHGLLATSCTSTRRCPGKELPIVIALSTSTRACGWSARCVDVADDEIEIGMPLRVDFDEVDDELTLPVWRKAMRTLEAGQVIPEWSLPITPTHVVSTAIATRDFQDVHHDRDLAQAARLEGHLHEHPDHHRAGREVRRRLGRPGRRAQGHRDPARRPGAPLRHAHLHRRRSPTVEDGDRAPSTSSAGCRSATTSPAPCRVAVVSALSGKAAIAGIGATEFSKESGRSELQLSVEARPARAGRLRADRRPTSTG